MDSKFLFGISIGLFVLGAVFFVAPVIAAPSRAPTATITVTNLTETSSGGQCTLRDAIIAANTNAAVLGCAAGSGADMIGFGALSGTIILTGSLPTIGADLTIDGSNNITISGNDLWTVLNVSVGKFKLNNITIQNGRGSPNGGAIRNFANGTVTISNTNFLSNTASNANADGGAIDNLGILDIWNSSFRANLSAHQGGAIHVSNSNASITGTSFISNTVTDVSSEGGAIYQETGVVTVTTSTFSLNRSAVSGGAIEAVDGLRVSDSTFGDNATNGNGGAIDGPAGSSVVTITKSVFSNNSAGRGGAFSTVGHVTISNSAFLSNQSLITTGQGGGGIHILSNTSITSSISNSSFTSNSADRGGAIYIGGGALAITNTTMSGNTAKRDGGGLYNSGTTTTTLNNVTVAYNVADNDSNSTGDGGGIFSSSGIVNVKNTLIANNTDGGGQAPDCGGTLISQGNNFLGLATGCTGFVDGVNSDHVANPTNPLLQPLGYYGGTTLVHALQAASAALNNGNNSTCASTDQRGVARPVGVNCDIGAYEGVGSLIYLPLILR